MKLLQKLLMGIEDYHIPCKQKAPPLVGSYASFLVPNSIRFLILGDLFKVDLPPGTFWSALDSSWECAIDKINNKTVNYLLGMLKFSRFPILDHIGWLIIHFLLQINSYWTFSHFFRLITRIWYSFMNSNVQGCHFWFEIKVKKNNFSK